jgi:hypothetical protein
VLVAICPPSAFSRRYSTSARDHAPDGLRRGSNEHDPDLGIVTPDRLACSSGVTSLDEGENSGNAGCGLNLEACAGL